MTESPVEVVKRIRGLPFQFGGEEHSGWLPPGAAVPLPTPIANVVLDIEIQFSDFGYFLYWSSEDGEIWGDYWFQSLADAETAAADDFGVEASQWETG